MYVSKGDAMCTGPKGWRVAVASLDGVPVYVVHDPHGYARGSARPKHAGALRSLAAVQAELDRDAPGTYAQLAPCQHDHTSATQRRR